MSVPLAGQRWISSSEPVLGLGLVLKCEDGCVEMRFPAADETRHYALESAPLVRVRFKPGDMLEDHGGKSFEVVEVREQAGLLTYFGEDCEVAEAELSDTLSFTSPQERLLAGMWDDPRDFDLRVRALRWNSKLRQSPVRGLCGARIDLIPHQFAIVDEAVRRVHPRLLLADEVGLGKTIEACLIMHCLYLSGRAKRVLILVPGALVHQWFVELLRRFHLSFAIFDEARCVSIEAHDEGANPFTDSSMILADMDFLTANPQRAGQAREAGFDVLIVDEAHHLEWSPEEVSPAYAVVESLACEVPSVLLLTATPEQLGLAGHFARLRLLDPERYGDFEAFQREADSYESLAQMVEALDSGGWVDEIESVVGDTARGRGLVEKVKAGERAARAALMGELIDRFGTGRVLFRNTREQLTGFPKRQPHLYPLTPEMEPCEWLAELLRQLAEGDKVLLITGTPEAAIATREKLLDKIHVESALFHEELSLIERDRHAAWFADPDGARILICSEIGSEGRNFQFAHHLVLFGLPRDPELLEQRIGRLDRIGQTETIRIHVPYVVGHRSEWHARWLHEGLDAFSQPLKGATALAHELLPQLDALGENPDEEAFVAFLKRSKKRRDEVAKQLARGHDRLLKWSAPKPERAQEIIDAVRGFDQDDWFERFVVYLLDHAGLEVSDLAARTYRLDCGPRFTDGFIDLPDDGMAVTFDREMALAREDFVLVTPDHPVVRDAMDHLLAAESGNASFAHWETGRGKAVLFEACFVLEVVAPDRLYLDRFLPPTAIFVRLDHQGNDLSDAPAIKPLQPSDARRLVTQEAFRQQIFPELMSGARRLAEQRVEAKLTSARERCAAVFAHELERLSDLASRNPHVGEAEVGAMNRMREASLGALANHRLRLDCLRVIWRT